MTPFKFNYSGIRSFTSCRRKYYYQYVLNLEKKERSLYYDVGSAFHKALESWYKDYDYKNAVTAIIEYFQERIEETTIDKESIPERIPELNNAMILVLGLMKAYREKYFIGLDLFNVKDVEISFEHHLESELVFYGTADLLVENENGLWLLEHKTAASIDNKYKMKLLLDYQCMAYIYGISKKIDKRINGVLYNVIVKDLPKKPKLLKSGKLSTNKMQKTTIKLFKQAIVDNDLLIDDYVDFLETLRHNQREYFYREYLAFPNQLMTDFENELIQVGNDMRRCIDENSFYKNTHSCVVFGVCPFFDVCTAIYPESIIDQNYKTKGQK